MASEVGRNFCILNCDFFRLPQRWSEAYAGGNETKYSTNNSERIKPLLQEFPLACMHEKNKMWHLVISYFQH